VRTLAKVGIPQFEDACSHSSQCAVWNANFRQLPFTTEFTRCVMEDFACAWLGTNPTAEYVHSEWLHPWFGETVYRSTHIRFRKLHRT